MKGLCSVAFIISVLGVVVGQEEEREQGGKETHITLSLDWAMNWGEWGSHQYCPTGTFATAFEIKVESEDAMDDTSMNGIKLFCNALPGVMKDARNNAKEYTITSTVQEWGHWRGVRECPNGVLTGLRMKSEDDQGFLVDDTAANDLDMQCDHSTNTLNGGGNHWGTWSSWESCPEGWAICGIETRVESSAASDDTALNDVRMFCCDTNTPLSLT